MQSRLFLRLLNRRIPYPSTLSRANPLSFLVTNKVSPCPPLPSAFLLALTTATLTTPFSHSDSTPHSPPPPTNSFSQSVKSLSSNISALRQHWTISSTPGAKNLAIAVISTNILVFSTFRFLRRTHSKRLYQFMNRNFTMSNISIRHGHYHLLLTNMFTHRKLPHLLLNSFTTSVAILFCSEFLSPLETASLFLFGGMNGSFFAIALQRLFPQKIIHKNSLLASSGGQSALLYFYSFAKDMTHKGWGEHTLKWPALFTFVADLFGIVRSLKHGVGKHNHMLHIGGALTGLSLFAFLHRPTRFDIFPDLNDEYENENQVEDPDQNECHNSNDKKPQRDEYSLCDEINNTKE